VEPTLELSSVLWLLPTLFVSKEKIKGFKASVSERRKQKEARNREVLLGDASASVLGKSADEHGRAEDMNQSMMDASRCWVQNGLTLIGTTLTR